MEMTDERLDQLFDKQIIVPQKHRFFIVKLNDRFAPKYGFSKSLDGDHLLKPWNWLIIAVILMTIYSEINAAELIFFI